jgi:eukaryotic-like serine/threonine-protein kinase
MNPNKNAIGVGKTVGPYRIDALVGAGGMGIVYRAHDGARQRTVAIKVVDRRHASGASSRWLVREARVAAALDHPSICGIHGIGFADGQPFIVMEHVEGRPLASLIPRGGLAPDAVLGYATQICAAVAHAHARGIVHRDLKSSNILVSADGRATLVDFGLAIHDAGAEASDVETTWTRGIRSGAGTVPYMAPEVLRGQPADRRSDVWALGIVIYEMLAGRRPFRGATRYELASRILSADTVRLPRRVPDGWREVVARSLRKAPAERYPCAGALSAALARLGTGV